MPVFILVVFGSVLAMNLLWVMHADYLLRRKKFGWKARVGPPAFALGMSILLTAYFLARRLDFPLREFIPSAVIILLYLWHLVVLPVWLACVPVATAIAFLTGRMGRRRKREPREAARGAWDRRRFIGALGAAAPPAFLFGLAVVSIPRIDRFRIRRFELPVEGLPSPLDGLTIAHVSDAHVGPFTHGRTLREIARATNELRCDLVVMTGDLINDNLDDLPAALDMVAEIDARHGVYLCEGNHDLIPSPTEFSKRTRAAGFNLLVNETKTLRVRGERLQLLGLRWGSGGIRRTRRVEYSDDAIGRSMKELLTFRDPDAFPILLAHHPHAFDPASAAGLPLVLAGHTHGGQLMVNEDLGFGPALFRYWTGIYQKNRSALVVSNGVGNWFPLRTAAPAEIVHLTLRAPRL